MGAREATTSLYGFTVRSSANAWDSQGATHTTGKRSAPTNYAERQLHSSCRALADMHGASDGSDGRGG
jgi:hypothetical protein